jgi:hypothetical protein
MRWPRAIAVIGGQVMRPLSKRKHRRAQWQYNAQQRGERERDQRKQKARLKAERAQATKALKATQARLRQLEAHRHGRATVPKVDVVHVALQLLLEARLGFRAVSRGLTLLALALGIKTAPGPHTRINGVIRLSLVRLDSARPLRGLPLSPAPFTNGLLWLSELRIGLGSGKMLAVLALDAHQQQLVNAAPSLRHGHGIGVAVAESWTGEALADVLDRLIAQMGRPAASRKDGGSDVHQAADVLEERGRGSPCIADLSHAAAGMLQHSYPQHPACARFVSACGSVSGKRKQTLLACLAPPTVRTKSRFMPGHR